MILFFQLKAAIQKERKVPFLLIYKIRGKFSAKMGGRNGGK